MTVEFVLVQALRYFIPGLCSMLFRIFGLGYKSKKHAVVGLLLFCFYMLAVPSVLIPLMGYYAYTKIAFFVLVIGNLIVYYFSNDNFLKTAFMHQTQANMVFVLSIICNTVRHVIGFDENYMLLVLSVVFGTVLLIALRFFAKPLRFMAEHIQSGWGAMLLIPTATVLVGMGVEFSPGIYFANQEIFSLIIIVSIEGCFFLYVSILYRNLVTITKLANEKLDDEMLRLSAQTMKEQIDLTQQEYRLSIERVEQVRRMRHDMNHHLLVISSYLSAGALQEAENYIEHVSAAIPDKPISDKNLISASFLSKYSRLCKENQISFLHDVKLNEVEIIDKIALGALLGNSLQNAFEAARKAEPERRVVSISGRQVHNNIILTVKNGYNGHLKPNYATTKTGDLHGIGLMSMKRITDEHNGYLEVEHTEQEFVLTLVMTNEAAQ